MLGVKPWKTSITLKEILVRPIEIAEALLKGHAVALIKPEVIFVSFQGGKYIRSLVVCQNNTVFLIGTNPFGEKVIVYEPARPKHLEKNILLCFGRIYPGFVSLLHSYSL